MHIDRSQYIRHLQHTHSALVELTAGSSDPLLDFRPAPDAWSTREILAHLVDDEMYVMRTRLERMMKEERPELAPHDEARWYTGRNTSRDAIGELLFDFALQRAASLGIIMMLRDTDWQRTGYQPEYGVFTAEEWLTHWVEHDGVHLRQIAANRAAYEATPAG